MLARIAFAIILLTMTCSCSPEPSVAVDRVPPHLEELHARIYACRQDYEQGVQRIVEGDSVLGRNLLEAATRRMATLAETCLETSGCDMQLFNQALGKVLRERRKASRAERRASSPSSRRDERPPSGDDDSPIVGVIPEIGRSIAILNGSDLRELIELNGPVNAAIYDWLTWDRPALMDAFENYQFLRRRVAPIYEEAGMPEALLFAMMATETGAKVHAYSRAGAAGPLQFMRTTGRRYGLNYVDGFDMRYDPEAATRASVAYLNDQFRALNNDLEKTLAAYNGGESRMRRLNRKLGGADFWDPEMYDKLPTETRDYVPKVLAAAWLFLHEREYGLDFPGFENVTTSVELTEEIALGELTICLGHAGYHNGWYRTLRNLNPRRSGIRRVSAGEQVEMPARLVARYVDNCVDNAPPRLLARTLHEASFPGQ